MQLLPGRPHCSRWSKGGAENMDKYFLTVGIFFLLCVLACVGFKLVLFVIYRRSGGKMKFCRWWGKVKI